MYRDENGSYSQSSRFTAHADVQLQRRHNKSVSKRCDKADRLQLEDLTDLSDEDCTRLKHLVHKTFPMCNINLIHQVNAPQMYGMYLLRKEELQSTPEYLFQEIILYHVTTKSRALESLKSGLDWRRTRRSKYGRGVSFSDDADYANYYAADYLPDEDDADSRVIIMCTVLVNKTHPVSGKRKETDLILPAGTADTTVSTNGRVYVKYNDYDFYPLYFVYYQRTPELIYESKYFWKNSDDRLQQNHLVAQQQELQTQHDLDQAQLELEKAQREVAEAQRDVAKAQREIEQRKRTIDQRKREIERSQMESQHEQKQEQPQTRRQLQQTKLEQKRAKREQNRAKREQKRAKLEQNQEHKRAKLEQKQVHHEKKQTCSEQKQKEAQHKQKQSWREQKQKQAQQEMERAGRDMERAGRLMERAGRDLERAHRNQNQKQAWREIEWAEREMERVGREMEWAGRKMERARRELEQQCYVM